MITVLEDILCMITALASVIEYAAVSVVNFVITALGGLIAIISPLLPNMPAFPDLSSLDMSWLGWFIPVSSIVAVIFTGISLFATMFGLRIALRWVKAL